MLKKKLTKYLWFGSDVDSKNNPITPQPAPEGEPLDGLNEGELYIHNNSKNPTLYTLSSDGKVVPIGGNTDVLDKRYLRKDKDDRSVGKISSDKGFESGTYVKGLVGGSGAWIGADGYGEMSGLTLREFFEVPEYRNNRVDVVSGELWNAVAFGLVEEVEITGEETGILKIKLEENERCGLHVGDYCRGIFADFSGGSNWEGPDECKFLHLYGFSTSYFTPKKIIESKEGLFVCEYALKPETKQHPTKSMKFAVYGNPTDTTRQASAYATRTYKRYLNKVDTWVIDPDKHIYAQYGDLNGLVIDGVEMKGYGSFQSNAYFKGVQIQLSPEQLESLKGDSAYSAQLTNNVGTIRLDKDGNMAEGLYEESIVTAIKDGEEAEVTAKDKNGQESTVTVTNHKLTTTVQAYKGNVPLFYSSSATSGSFAVSLTCVGCTAFVVNGSVVVSSITNTKDCRVNVTVNCEGMAVYNLVYNVVFVQDGKDGSSGQDAEWWELTPHDLIIKKDSNNALEPKTATYSLLVHEGSVTSSLYAKWELRGKVNNSDSWILLFSTDNTPLKQFNVDFEGHVKNGYRLFEIKATHLSLYKSFTSTASVVQDGDTGNGIKSITEYYLSYPYKSGVTTSHSDFNWGTTMPELDSTNKYLWNYELIEYTNGDKTSSTPVFIGTYSQDGRGIKSITEYYLSYPYNTGVTKNTDGWSTTVPTIDSTNKYLWNYEVVTYTDNYKEETNPVVIGVYGDTGNNAVSYAISPENLLIGKTMTGSLEPETATFKVWKNDGGKKTNITAQWYVLGKKAPSTGQGDVLMGGGGIWGGSLDVNFAGYVREGYKYFEVQADIEAGGTLSLVSNVVVVQDGEKGEPGASGAMARYRGEFVFNNDEPYVYDSEYRDIVIYEGNVYQVYAFGLSVTEAPTVSGDSDNDGKWQRANKFRFVAMDTALIDDANIAGFIFNREGYDNNGYPVGSIRSQKNNANVTHANDGKWMYDNGYRKSPAIKDGGFTVETVTFKVPEKCLVMFEMIASTEKDYDFGYIGRLDKDYIIEEVDAYGNITLKLDNSIKTDNILSLSGVAQDIARIEVEEGEYTVQIIYSKSSSNKSNEDCVRYKFIGSPKLYLSAYTGMLYCNDVNIIGNINATSGVFSGYIRTDLVNIIDSDAIQVEPQFTTNEYAYKLNKNVYVDATFEEVVLPCTEEYNGVRVIIMDSYYLKTRMATPPTIIRTEDGSTIKCGLYGGDKPSGSQYQMSSIKIDCGAVELIYKYIQTDYGQQRAWIVLNHSCGTFEEY